MKTRILLYTNKLVLAVMFSAFCSISFSQTGYKKVFKYDDYRADWALVKTNSGTYGFIDRDGNSVVPPVYTKIEKFEFHDNELALVKNVSGAYGFIDRNGEVVVPVIYWSKEEAIQKLNSK